MTMLYLFLAMSNGTLFWQYSRAYTLPYNVN